MRSDRPIGKRTGGDGSSGGYGSAPRPVRACTNTVAGNWLEVDLEGTESNRDALGAVVTSHVGDRSQARQVAGGSDYLARSSAVLHFGLGDAKTVDRLEIRWPSGGTQVLTDVAANQRVSVREEPTAQ